MSFNVRLGWQEKCTKLCRSWSVQAAVPFKSKTMSITSTGTHYSSVSSNCKTPPTFSAIFWNAFANFVQLTCYNFSCHRSCGCCFCEEMWKEYLTLVRKIAWFRHKNPSTNTFDNKCGAFSMLFPRAQFLKFIKIIIILLSVLIQTVLKLFSLQIVSDYFYTQYLHGVCLCFYIST